MRKRLKVILSLILKWVIPFFRNNKKILEKKSVKKILIIQEGGIGDILRIFAPIQSLHANFPEASISFMGFSYTEEIFEIFPNKEIITDIIHYEPEGIHKNLLKRLSFILILRRQNFDLIYAPSRGIGSDGTILMTFFIGAPHRIGFDINGVGFLNTATLKFERDSPILKQNLSLLKVAGLDVISEDVRLRISDVEMNFAKDLIGDNKYSSLFSLHPGVAWNAKFRIWPIKNYIFLIKELIEKQKAKIILIGTLAETEIGNKIQQVIKSNAVINLIGRTTIPQMAAIIKSSDFFIGSDSGPIHIAEFMGTPFIGLFGPTLPNQVLSSISTTPRVILKRDIPCSPCYTHQNDFKPNLNCAIECLRSVSVEDVLEAIKQLSLICEKRGLLCE